MKKLGTLARCAMVVALVAGCATEAQKDDSAGLNGCEQADDDDCSAVDSPHDAPVAASTPESSKVAATVTSIVGVSASIQPNRGSVEGGTQVLVGGTFPSAAYAVTIGGIPCGAVVRLGDSTLSCVTGKHVPREIDEDVVVEDVVRQESSTVGRFHYFCPWVWREGEPASCGAAPPAHTVADERASVVITQFQPGHGFATVNATSKAIADTEDFVFGSQSVAFQTDGTARTALLGRQNPGPLDFTKRIPKVWLRLDGVVHAKSVELHLGAD